MSANPSGRPRGSRNKTTSIAEALIDGEAEAIVRKAIELAKAGDISMIRTLLGYILPARKERHVVLDLPPIKSAQDALVASRMVVEAIASGQITAAEGGELTKAIDLHAKLYTSVQLEADICVLEQQQGRMLAS